MYRIVFAGAVVLGLAAHAHAQLSQTEASRLAAAARVVQDIRSTIPQQYWERARCVAVIPDLKKAAFIFGGEYGKGVMSCRAGDQWSAPIFMQLAKGSWGFQAGAEQVDVVLLVMNESGVQKLLQNKVNLGADASVAAGPIGRQGQVGTDATLKAEILSYSKAQGLFAGIDLSGGILRPDEDANRKAYGPDASPKTILASRAISAPTEATAFLTALANASAPSAAPGGPSGSSAATTSRPSNPAATTTEQKSSTAPATTTNASDLRARIMEMQRTLDGLMSASQAPVGTTGTTTATTTGNEPSATVTVDRARLVQLRRQLDDLLAALDRR